MEKWYKNKSKLKSQIKNNVATLKVIGSLLSRKKLRTGNNCINSTATKFCTNFMIEIIEAQISARPLYCSFKIG